MSDKHKEADIELSEGAGKKAATSIFWGGAFVGTLLGAIVMVVLANFYPETFNQRLMFRGGKLTAPPAAAAPVSPAVTPVAAGATVGLGSTAKGVSTPNGGDCYPAGLITDRTIQRAFIPLGRVVRDTFGNIGVIKQETQAFGGVCDGEYVQVYRKNGGMSVLIRNDLQSKITAISSTLANGNPNHYKMDEIAYAQSY